MSNLVIYHGGCTDGVAAAWAFNQVGPGHAVFHPGSYGKEPPYDLIAQAHRVYLVDFSYKAPVMETIAARSNRPPTVLDHHDTAEADLGPLLESGTCQGTFDRDRCGALITWQWFSGRPPPPMLLQIDLADRRAPGYSNATKGTMLALRTRPHAPASLTPKAFEDLFHRWDWLMAPENFDDLTNEGAHVLAYYTQRVDEHVAKAVPWTIGEHIVPVVNAPYYLASDVAGTLSRSSPSHIGAVYWINGDGQVTFSLRSCQPDPNTPAPHVGEFAEAFAGGGGHQQAAGFTAPAESVDPIRRQIVPMEEA